MASVPTFTPGNAFQQSDGQFAINPPKWGVYQNTPQAALANATSTRIVWDTLAYDQDPTSWSASSPGQVTFNTPGVWLVIVTLLWGVNGSGYRQADLRKNSGGNPNGGSRVGINIAQATSGVSVNNLSVYVPGIVAGDYLELYGYQTSGGALAPYSNNYPGGVGIQAQRVGS